MHEVKEFADHDPEGAADFSVEALEAELETEFQALLQQG